MSSAMGSCVVRTFLATSLVMCGCGIEVFLQKAAERASTSVVLPVL